MMCVHVTSGGKHVRYLLMLNISTIVSGNTRHKSRIPTRMGHSENGNKAFN